MTLALAESLLESAANPKETDYQWCKHPEKPIRCAGLCNHCYRIKLLINKLQKKVEKVQARNINHPLGPVPPELEHELRVAIEMRACAQHEGRYAETIGQPISGLDLEMLFRWVSKRLLKKDYYYGIANLLDWSFDDTQRRLIFHLLHRMQREYYRANRRNQASAVTQNRPMVVT
jgi:hypothetical protein